MDVTKNRRKKPAPEAVPLPPDLSELLHEIEKEPVSEKLLALAVRLQEALVERRRLEEVAEIAAAAEPAGKAVAR